MTRSFTPRLSDETRVDVREAHRSGLIEDETRFLDGVRERVRATIDAARRADAATAHGLATSELLEAASLESILDGLVGAGGKLVRPRLVRLGYLAALTAAASSDGPSHVGASDSRPAPVRADTMEDAVRVAAAFELLHVFGLVQDDVMDASDTRRGRPAAHRTVAASAPDPSSDSAARLGDSVAILAGDLAFALASRLVRGIPDAAADAWDSAVVELVHGQRLDLVFAAEARLDAASTMLVAQAKSGSYTVSRPLEVGALLATGDVPAWLRVYGQALGEAFALADDVIGLWGDPRVTGKPAGEDLRERKPSSVLGLADAALDGELARRLAPGRPALSAHEIDEWLGRLDAAGVRDVATRRIVERRDAALAALASVPAGEARDALVRFAHEISVRDA